MFSAENYLKYEHNIKSWNSGVTKFPNHKLIDNNR